jgi:hypothetical protein
MIHDADSLRPPERICHPDPRTVSSVTTPTDQHAFVASFVLNPAVPEAIAIHFETAKNLYLYAFFVYRFYPVAEQQALGTLEFALRERQPEFVKQYKETCRTKKQKDRRNRDPGLRALLNNAIKKQLVQNEAFQARERWACERALARYRYEQVAKMSAEGMTEMTIEYSGVTPTDEDLNHDWLKDFLDAIPKIRNEYAHGSDTLAPPSVLHTIEVVADLVNQLFPAAVGRVSAA